MDANSKGFNIIFCSQGSALTIFDKLLPELNNQLPLNKIGLFVADQPYFDHYTSNANNFSDFNIKWLREWEIQRLSRLSKPNYTRIHKQEKLYGTPNLWPALISDRRIFLGPSTKYKQDYCPRYSHLGMLRLLQTSIDQIEKFIANRKPDAIIGFNMVTLSEFLFYLIAKQKNIPYLQIKNAKISNLVTLFPDPLNISDYISQNSNQQHSTSIRKQTHEYLRNAQNKSSTYEGHVILKPPSLSTILQPILFKKLASGAIFSVTKNMRYPHDNHSSGLRSIWQFNVTKPLQAQKHHRFLSNYYLSPKNLAQTKYVFFPLHTEPEIALSIYGRHHQNQIEVIRNIAQSIPVTWSVVVKDHPRSLGTRKLQYYKKLLQIPNVKLVNPYLSSYDIIDHAQAIVTITSWVGFEAIMSKKPVITMGECTYNALPDTMVVKNTSYQTLASDINNAITNHRYNEKVLLDHIATVINLSHPINIYSDVLSKPNRHTIHTSPSNKDKTWQNFASYIMANIQNKKGYNK